MITIPNMNSDQNNQWTNRQSRKKKYILFGISVTTLILMFCVAIPLIVTFYSPTTAIHADLESTSTTATNTAIVTDSITSSISPTNTLVTTAIITTITTTTVSTSTNTFTATTGQRFLFILTNPGDTIVSLYYTVAGGDVGGSNGYYPSNSKGPASAIDNNIGTKYLNFGGSNCEGCFTNSQGVNTGFLVIPLISNTTIVRALRFATANDFPYRDPITVTLEGSNAATVNMLYGGSSWTLIYSGPTGISATVDPGRNVSVSQQNFLNTTPYLAYRLLITSQRGNANSVQYAESLILGYV